MPFIHEVILSATDVTNLVRELEAKYGISTEQFLRSGPNRENLSEDDVLLWDALVDELQEFKRIEESLRRDYLSSLRDTQSSSKTPQQDDQILLVA